MTGKIVNALRFIWTTTVICAGIFIGSSSGWGSHGLDGAIALGFCGLIIGAFLSFSPRLVLEILLSGR